jgi:SAM-dependent methyltransferase
VAHNQTCWKALEASLFKLTRFLEREHFRNDNAPPPPRLDLNAALKVISPDLTVRHGPFCGMKYPMEKSVGSELVPKLLGSYERELHPLLERLRARDYSEIVDIGCAEGFYAVGLARLFPKAKVFAYDTNPEAIRLCRLMARENRVENQLITGAFCDAKMLREMSFTRRALVVIDCEGYEKHLFTPETVRALALHDVLIEVHDMVDIEISGKLRAAFQATHQLEVIDSVDDIRKAQTYDYPELHPFSLAERRLLLREWRASGMEWFYFSPRD